MSRVVAGRYRIVAALGGGGTSLVHRAAVAGGGPDVALKELRPQFAADPTVRRRFLREAELARKLAHSGIVGVLDSGEEGGVPYLVMELMAGETLRARLQREGKLAMDAAWPIFVDVARALDHAHAQGVIHRDVKPENIFLEATGAKLGDFGNARVVSVASVTGTSLTWGTPEYVAPEMFMRGRADPRADFYALGVVFYEMLTGRVPWSRDQTITRVAGSAAPFEPTGAGDHIDDALRALVAASPSQRPASGEEAIMRLSQSGALVATDSATCSHCGVARPADVPRCMSCGQETLRIQHMWGGRWCLMLEKLEDDATMTEKLLSRVGPLVKPLKVTELHFLTGAKEMYSMQEKQTGTELPAVLFSDLDRDTALRLETLFRNDGLEVRAAKGRSLSRWLRTSLKRMGRTEATLIAVVVIGPLAGLRIGHFGWIGGLAFAGFIGGVFLLGNLFRKARTGDLRKPVFELRPQDAAMPAADSFLASAAGTGARIRDPEVRALLGDVATELYRLARRAEQVAAASRGGSSEGELLRRTIAAAPALLDGLRRMASRLDDLDAALDGQTEGELMQTLARLERAAAAPDADRAAVAATRRDVEASLERRHAAEQERACLSAKLCQLLGHLRLVYRRALTMDTIADQEARALEAASADLDALLVASAAS